MSRQIAHQKNHQHHWILHDTTYAKVQQTLGTEEDVRRLTDPDRSNVENFRRQIRYHRRHGDEIKHKLKVANDKVNVLRERLKSLQSASQKSKQGVASANEYFGDGERQETVKSILSEKAAVFDEFCLFFKEELQDRGEQPFKPSNHELELLNSLAGRQPDDRTTNVWSAQRIFELMSDRAKNFTAVNVDLEKTKKELENQQKALRISKEEQDDLEKLYKAQTESLRIELRRVDTELEETREKYRILREDRDDRNAQQRQQNDQGQAERQRLQHEVDLLQSERLTQKARLEQLEQELGDTRVRGPGDNDFSSRDSPDSSNDSVDHGQLLGRICKSLIQYAAKGKDTFEWRPADVATLSSILRHQGSRNTKGAMKFQMEWQIEDVGREDTFGNVRLADLKIPATPSGLFCSRLSAMYGRQSEIPNAEQRSRELHYIDSAWRNKLEGQGFTQGKVLDEVDQMTLTSVVRHLISICQESNDNSDALNFAWASYILARLMCFFSSEGFSPVTELIQDGGRHGDIVQCASIRRLQMAILPHFAPQVINIDPNADNDDRRFQAFPAHLIESPAERNNCGASMIDFLDSVVDRNIEGCYATDDWFIRLHDDDGAVGAILTNAVTEALKRETSGLEERTVLDTEAAIWLRSDADADVIFTKKLPELSESSNGKLTASWTIEANDGSYKQLSFAFRTADRVVGWKYVACHSSERKKELRDVKEEVRAVEADIAELRKALHDSQ